MRGLNPFPKIIVEHVKTSSVTFMTFQAIMWSLTWFKRCEIRNRLHPSLRADVPFLSIVFRDGSIVLAILSGVYFKLL